jgi:hypothetical protein
MTDKRNTDSNYIHINYIPTVGWVLSIMSRLQGSSNARLRSAFEQWSSTRLKELGFAITTRMHMLGLAIQRLNANVHKLRDELRNDLPAVDLSLSEGYAFGTKDRELPYELLLDMDCFIFEARSLYEIVGEFVRVLFKTLFDRVLKERDIQELLSRAGIDTVWIEELRETRKLFFHETAPWLAVRVERSGLKFFPVLLKEQEPVINPTVVVDFETLRKAYEGFVAALSELHRYINEQIRLAESQAPE